MERLHGRRITIAFLAFKAVLVSEEGDPGELVFNGEWIETEVTGTRFDGQYAYLLVPAETGILHVRTLLEGDAPRWHAVIESGLLTKQDFERYAMEARVHIFFD
jgi:hypothetical protein